MSDSNKHPQYPAGTPGGKGGEFRPKNKQTVVDPNLEEKIASKMGISPKEVNNDNLLEKYELTEQIINEQSKLDLEEKVNSYPPLSTYSLDVQNATSEIFQKSEKSEPKITKDITFLCKMFDGEMFGLEHRLKSPESIAQKIDRSMKIWHEKLESAINQIKDSIRYTCVIKDDKFSNSVNNIVNKLSSAGYQIVEFDNRFITRKGESESRKTSYKDICLKMIAPNGSKCELQFNTYAGIKAKNGTMKNEDGSWAKRSDGILSSHAYYEMKRKLPRYRDDLPENIKTRIKYLNYRIESLFNDVPNPEGVENLLRENYGIKSY